MDIGTLLMMAALSYGLGILWYDLLPGRLPERVWRVAAYPFLGIFVAHALMSQALTADLKFGGLGLIMTGVGSVVGVLVDWLITQARHPSLVSQPEPRAA